MTTKDEQNKILKDGGIQITCEECTLDKVLLKTSMITIALRKEFNIPESKKAEIAFQVCKDHKNIGIQND